MKRRNRTKKTIRPVMVVAAGALATLWVIERASSPAIPDPPYKGKAASAWANEFIQSESWESQQALKSVSRAAVPYLIPRLYKQDSAINKLCAEAWLKLPNFLKSRVKQPLLARTVRMRAVVALREMGPSAKDAVPALIDRLKDKDGTIRLHSAIALGNIGAEAKAAVLALKPFLKDRHTVRVYVASALWKIEQDAAEVLPVLEQGVAEEGAPFRWAAAVFLGEMGAAAERAIPALEQAAQAQDKDTASCAVQALAQISATTVPFLIQMLKDPDPAMRISAAIALERTGPIAPEAIPALTALVNDKAAGLPVVMGRGNDREEVGQAARRAIAVISLESAPRPTNAEPK